MAPYYNTIPTTMPVPNDEKTVGADLQALKEVRKLVIDICRQNGGGHGGSAIGMAPLAVALWKYTMRYNPLNPEVCCTFHSTGTTIGC